MKTITFNQEPIRLDKYLAKILDLSRENIKINIKLGIILVNNKEVKAGYNLLAGDEIIINDLVVKEDQAKISSQAVNLDIIYEDNFYIGVNKPKNIITYNAIGHLEEPSIASSIKKMYSNLCNKDSVKPGIVHRLDYETSGALLICKDDSTYRLVQKLFKERKIKKTYLAICQGLFKAPRGEISIPLSKKFGKKIKMIKDSLGKEAITKYEVIAEKEGASLVRVNLITGRTHQIRAHLSFIGHPLIGDTLYGGGAGKNSFFLHSQKIEFICPRTSKEVIIEAKLPAEFLSELTNFNYY